MYREGLDGKCQSIIDRSKFSIPKAAIEFLQSPGPLGSSSRILLANTLDAQIVSDVKSNPLAIEIKAIRSIAISVVVSTLMLNRARSHLGWQFRWRSAIVATCVLEEGQGAHPHTFNLSKKITHFTKGPISSLRRVPHRFATARPLPVYVTTKVPFITPI